MEEYLRAGAYEKGLALASCMENNLMERIQYMSRFPARFARSVRYEQNDCKGILREMIRLMQPYASYNRDVADFLARSQNNA